MTIFRRLYDKVLHWADHQHAPYYLAGVSFIESSFFPIPPDVMLIPMVMSQPKKAWEYAWITVMASILGGLFGYLIGYFAFEMIGWPIIQFFHAELQYHQVAKWFGEYGFYIMVLAGATPIPYKIFTIGAGAAQMVLIPFVLGSLVGRFLRFFVVVGLIKTVGKKLQPFIVKYIERVGWTVVGLCVIGVSYLMLTGCSHLSLNVDEPAPVISANLFEAHPKGDVHVVKTNETLYAIAWRYGEDYRDLAAYNQIPQPYRIYVGQKLKLKGKKAISTAVAEQKTSRKAQPAIATTPTRAVPIAKGSWIWPAKGKILKKYSIKGTNTNKGIDIGGHLDQPILAAGDGKVVYSGSGLRGYGQLIIIKHNANYLSAYAHNHTLLVKEGDSIHRGQKIALMGNTGTDTTKLHFEIRQNGKPINPLDILPAQ